MTNEELNARINELWEATKRGELPRQARFAAIEQLTEEYMAETGRRPDPAMLDRLATLCLYEEVTDHHPDKIIREENPLLSRHQIKRRKYREKDVSELVTGKDNIVLGKYKDKRGRKKKIYDYMVKSK